MCGELRRDFTQVWVCSEAVWFKVWSLGADTVRHRGKQLHVPLCKRDVGREVQGLSSRAGWIWGGGSRQPF